MAADPAPTRRLEELLGHRFRDPRLLEEALTHASRDEEHNERLEFLGDAVLDLVAAEMLYTRHPDAREGRLTQWKSLLVSRATLGRVGERLDLGRWLRLGAGLGDRRTLPRSLPGNTVEALIGAIYLDTGGGGEGLRACAAIAERLLAPELHGLPARHERAHAKMLLQEWAQRARGAPPEYRLTATFEDPETRSFRMCAHVAGRDFPPAWGTSKREAERRAAWEAVLVLRAEGERLGETDADPPARSDEEAPDGAHAD